MAAARGGMRKLMSISEGCEKIIEKMRYEVKKEGGKWKLVSDAPTSEETCRECDEEVTMNNYGGWIVCDLCYYEIAVAPGVLEKMDELE